MSKVGMIKLTKAPGERMRAATANIRRQFRIRNIMLVIVGAEATVFIALRTWGGF